MKTKKNQSSLELASVRSLQKKIPSKKNVFLFHFPALTPPSCGYLSGGSLDGSFSSQSQSTFLSYRSVLSVLLEPLPFWRTLLISNGVGFGSSCPEPLIAFLLTCRKEWDDLFLNSNYLARIRQAGINGRLRSSRFRSVCWKVAVESIRPSDRVLIK